jgi:SagB-type dehydrogenase family enzyme
MESSRIKYQFLRTDALTNWEAEETDQKKGIPFPPPQKLVPPEALLIDLVSPARFNFCQVSVQEALQNRESRRQYSLEPLTLDELSFLCWSVQGIRQVLFDGRVTRRTAPSAGARHPFETYLAVHRAAGLQMGLYRYLPFDHQLVLEYLDPELSEKMNRCCSSFSGSSAVTFIWTALPYRTAWRYSSMAEKFVAQDSGHLCQNLYLACEAIGAGTCAVGAYNQVEMDRLLRVDGVEELTVYAAPVGKLS